MSQPHEEGDVFDARYPPDTSLPPSDEYDHEGGQVGMYGKSEHDKAIVQAANPKCVWSFVEGDDGLYAMAGFRVVNWQNWFISSEPRPDGEDDYEEYQLLEDEVELDDEEVVADNKLIITSADRVFVSFQCLDEVCKADGEGVPEAARVDVNFLHTSGTPVCPNCDREMTMLDNIEVIHPDH